jgi:hypothetical protein
MMDDVLSDAERFVDAVGHVEVLACRADTMARAAALGARASAGIGHAALIGWSAIMGGIVVCVAAGALDRDTIGYVTDWRLLPLVLVPLYFEGKASRLARAAAMWRELSDSAVVSVETFDRATPSRVLWLEDRRDSLRARTLAMLSVTPAYVYDFVDDEDDDDV